MKQISTKQFVSMLFLTAIAMKMFLVPALMLRTIGKDGYLVMLGYILLEFVGLTFVVLIAKRNPDKTLYEILRETLGAVVSRIVVGFIAIFALFRCVLMISELKMFFTMTMYEQMNWNLMLLPVIALIIAFSIRPLRATGRVSELLLPIILISSLILSTLLLGDIDLSGLLPLRIEAPKKLIKGGATFPMWFGDSLLLSLALGKIKISKRFVSVCYIAKIVASVLSMLFAVSLFSAYSSVSTLVDYGNNVSNMTQFSLEAQDYGRFDLLLYCVWMLSVFITLALSFRAFTRSTEFLVNTRKHYPVSFIVGAFLYLLMTLLLKNENVVYWVMQDIPMYIVCPVCALILPLAYACCLIKYKANYGEEYEKKQTT